MPIIKIIREVILLNKIQKEKRKYGMKDFKKDVKETVITIAIIVLIAIVIGHITNRFIPSGTSWTYLKYDNKLYVLCSPEVINPEQLKRIKLTKVGTVKKEIFALFKPKSNNVSNGLKKGTEIYTSDRGEIIIKFKDQFHHLEDTAAADGWGNGTQIRLH